MPRFVGSRTASAWTRADARFTANSSMLVMSRLLTRSAPVFPAAKSSSRSRSFLTSSWRTRTASALATSPAACPPMPSHTTYSPSFLSTRKLSSLCSRLRPTSVSAEKITSVPIGGENTGLGGALQAANSTGLARSGAVLWPFESVWPLLGRASAGGGWVPVRRREWKKEPWSEPVEDSHLEHGPVPVSPDHDVIQQRNRHQGRRRGQRDGHLKVLTARCRIPARVVVDHHEGAGRMSHHRDQEIAGEQRAPVHATSSYLQRAAEDAASVETEHPHLLVVQAREAAGRPPGHRVGAQGEPRTALGLAAGGAPTELEDRRDASGLSGAETRSGRQARWGQFAEGLETSSTFEEGDRQLCGRQAIAPLSQHEGEELGVAELLDARPLGTLT